MAKKGGKKPGKRHGTGGMRYSQIPYAKRLQIRQMCDIKAVRDHSAKITMFCHSIALHELYGIGYIRLVRFSLVFKKLIDEYYGKFDVAITLAAKRLEQHGIVIPATVPVVSKRGLSLREQQEYAHAVQASYIAHVVGLIAANESLKFGKGKLEAISVRVAELTERYNAEGEGFIHERMERIGFPIIDGKVTACLDGNDQPVMYKRFLELEGGKEGNQ